MDSEQGTWADCAACGGRGEVPVEFPDTYFPVMVACRPCDGTGLGAWAEDDGDDDGDTRCHDAPYDYAGGRAAA